MKASEDSRSLRFFETVLELKEMHSGLGLTLLSVAVLTVPIPAQPVPETFTLNVPDGPISSKSGSSISLLCQVSPTFNIEPFEVKWYRFDEVNKPTLWYKDHKIQEAIMDPRFKGRVSLTGGLERGIASLRLERVTLEDSGEFVCYINNNNWYEKTCVVLAVSVIGSQPVISVAEARGGGQVNVTCSSEGWSPQPKVTWRNKEGTEITNGQEVQNTTDSQGLVSVSSWLLFSPSESDWLSCIVFLSDEWKTEGRILPVLPGGDYKKGFTVNQVLLVVLPVLFLVIIICALCFIIVFKRKGQIDQGLNVAETKRLIKENPVQSPANQTTSDNKDKLEENPVQSPANLTTTDNKDKPEENPVQSPANLTTTDNKDKPEGNTVQTPANPTTADNQVDLQGPENPVQSPANLTTTDNEDKLEDLLLGKKVKEEHITTDAKTASLAIRLSQKGKRVQYVKAKDKPDLQQSIHVLGNKGFDSGQHYWKVKIQDDDRKEEKLAWYLGVTKENAQCPLTPQNGFWVLFYEKEVGLHVYVDSVKTPTRQTTPTTVCVFLDCDKHTLSFYDADSGSLLYTFNDVKTTDTLYPVFSPGKRDPQPLKIY
ncbi:butyrophilin subfamily 3 member A1 isoform X4 [Esox lucius]|uniref:butyrophilin subfamily 3 member A1 isoform X4 n=1 Tax=Esox lucius TaxID=8010 RepID=UPI00147728BE|nr:butyrophilin subfamily 3 member A1 isoform X4 [Esox lucius]